MIAAQKGSAEHVRAHVAAGADVNLASEYDGRTPLQAACYYAAFQRPAIEAMLEAKADANRRDKRGAAALHYVVNGMNEVPASVLGRALDAFKVLIAAGADVNLARTDGFTPLHLAALHDYPGVVEILLAAGADPNLRTRTGCNALGYATKSPTVVKMLLSAGASIDTLASEGSEEPGQPLWRVAAVRSPQVLDLLLAAGLNVQQVDAEGQTILFHTQNPAAIKKLASMGIDVNRRDNKGHTALMKASRDLAAMTALVEAGADVNCCDNAGQTVLHHVAGRNVNPMCTLRPDTELVPLIAYLLSVGADQTLKGHDGATPLELAVKRRNTNAAQALRAHAEKLK